MNLRTNYNTYNFDTIIELNEHLVKIKKLDDIFEYLSSHLKKDFSLDKFSVSIKENLLFKNFDKNKFLKKKSFEVFLNHTEKLNITVFFNEHEEKNINSCYELVKTTFKLISQTIFNKYLEYRIIEMTLKDSLTGLYNRQYVDEYLKITLPLSQREDKKIAFLKVGIDQFKAVIDEFDYSVGDKVLKELAKSLEETVRNSDIVARIQSDEFLVILHNISNENNAIIVADKIINNFKDVKVVVNDETKQTLMKTICTGIAIYPDDADKIEEIFRSSDIALYEARNKGRSQFFKFKKENENIELF